MISVTKSYDLVDLYPIWVEPYCMQALSFCVISHMRFPLNGYILNQLIHQLLPDEHFNISSIDSHHFSIGELILY